MSNFFAITLCMLLSIAATPCLAGVADDPTRLTYLTEEFKPYNYLEQGKPKGLAVELLKLAWKEMGVPEQAITFVPWPRAYAMVMQEPNTVLFAMLQTPERSNKFKWAGPIAHSKTYFYARSNSPIKVEKIEDARGMTISVIQDYASEQLLQKHRKLITIDSLKSVSMALKKLDNGRVDLLAMEERAFMRHLKTTHTPSRNYRKVFLFHEAKSFFAFSLSTPDSLIRRFQDAINTTRKSEAFKKIEAHYLQ